MFWVIATDGALHDVTGCSIVYVAKNVIAQRVLEGGGCHRMILAPAETEEQAGRVRDRITTSMAVGGVLCDLRFTGTAQV